MPLNILRLNQRHQHPTPQITFIKALPGPGKDHAELLLSRVAAICHPIMVEHHISVVTLEEHEANREFIGRNFNAGEVIQLVLRSRSGVWLPFKSIVMVAMHELAHCKQMNHSRAFWAVRNVYARQMRDLWARGYTGEGVWGRGRELDDGTFETNEILPPSEEMPERLCGGTFRSRRRGRKRKHDGPELTYAERQKRRVEKKFGLNGEKLGEDQTVKFFLDGKKVISGKPRVAASQRGRELRAQAALVRFGALKAETSVKKDEEQGEEKFKTDGSEAGEGYGDSPSDQEDTAKADALDIDGKKLLDSKGGSMVKIEEEDGEDESGRKVRVKQELDELNDLWTIPEQHSSTIKKETEEKDYHDLAAETTKQGRPGESFYNSSRASSAPGGRSETRQQPPEGTQSDSRSEDMRSKLDTFHKSGSILTALRKQSKQKPQQKSKR